MIKVIAKMRDLNFYQLMQVYSEGNLENARDLYPNLAENEGIIRAEQDAFAYLEVFFSQPEAVYIVYSVENKYVSALRLEAYEDGFLLEALETAPEHRRKGYATALVRETISWLASQKTTFHLYSHVNKHNAASLAVHLNCGFNRIKECAVYADGSVLHSSCTLCYSFG